MADLREVETYLWCEMEIVLLYQSYEYQYPFFRRHLLRSCLREPDYRLEFCTSYQ